VETLSTQALPGPPFIRRQSCESWWGKDIDIVQVACLYDPAAYDDTLYDKVAVVLPADIEKAVPKRRAEFLAGRYCAQHTLTLLHHAPVHIGVGERRNPLWPKGIRGSISHSTGMAVAVATQDARISGVGVDIEESMERHVIEQVAGEVLTADDAALIAQCAILPEQSFTLIFSAKESFFKAAFPLVGRYFDFDTVSVVDLDEVHETFQLRLNRPLHPLLPEGVIVEGRFCLLPYEKPRKSIVATLVVLEA